MKYLLLGMTLLASPAWALVTPEPAGDKRICDVVYDPDKVVDVRLVLLNNIDIRFSPNERIVDNGGFIAGSDDVNIVKIQSDNVVHIKAKAASPPQPMSIRTVGTDGVKRDYMLQLTTYGSEEEAQPPVKIAANGDSIPSTAPSVNFCYVIRYSYKAEVTQAQVAAWRAKQAKDKADAAEIALHNQNGQRRNNHYGMIGDARIGPAPPGPGEDEIWDDGYTTVLHFPGNMTIPIILTRQEDHPNLDSQVNGFTVEQGGVIKIHGTYPFIRLRDGDRTLCIFNLAYSAIGNNPGTGTTSPYVERGLRGHE